MDPFPKNSTGYVWSIWTTEEHHQTPVNSCSYWMTGKRFWKRNVSSSSQAWWARSDKSSGYCPDRIWELYSDHCKTNGPNPQPKIWLWMQHFKPSIYQNHEKQNMTTEWHNISQLPWQTIWGIHSWGTTTCKQSNGKRNIFLALCNANWSYLDLH